MSSANLLVVNLRARVPGRVVSSLRHCCFAAPAAALAGRGITVCQTTHGVGALDRNRVKIVIAARPATGSRCATEGSAEKGIR